MLGYFIREKVWVQNFEPNLFPYKYKYSKILNPSHSSYLSAYEDGTECSETSAYKIQMPGNCPEESIQNSEHSEILKSRMFLSWITQRDLLSKIKINHHWEKCKTFCLFHATSLWPGRSEVWLLAGLRHFSPLPNTHNEICGLPILLMNVYRGSSPLIKEGGGVPSWLLTSDT
jgi:hypothetical protein